MARARPRRLINHWLTAVEVAALKLPIIPTVNGPKKRRRKRP